MSFLSTQRLSKILLFVLDQRQVIATVVPALRIVEHFDRQKYPALFLYRAIRFSWKSFALEQLEELLAMLVLWKSPPSENALLKILRSLEIVSIITF